MKQFINPDLAILLQKMILLHKTMKILGRVKLTDYFFLNPEIVFYSMKPVSRHPDSHGVMVMGL